MKIRIKYAFLAILIIIVALSLREIWAYLPYWFNFWIGDFLWAAMLYCAMIAIFSPNNKWRATLGLVAFCWIIEASQAWHTPWLDPFRQTTFGGVLLGHGFLWSDIVAYTAGAIAAYWTDKLILRSGDK
jgi:hypothetical protein